MCRSEVVASGRRCESQHGSKDEYFKGEREEEEETHHQAKDTDIFFPLKTLWGVGSFRSLVLCALQMWEASPHQSLDE